VRDDAAGWEGGVGGEVIFKRRRIVLTRLKFPYSGTGIPYSFAGKLEDLDQPQPARRTVRA
jgi:hypothetical protein